MNLILNTALAERYADPGAMEAEVRRAQGFYGELAGLTPADPAWGAAGWRNCREAACELELIRQKAAEIRKHAEVFVLVGVGGSNQAARAMIEALQAPGGPEIVYSGNTLSAHYLQKVLRHIQGKSVYINVIAKNFETLEPGSHFRVLRQAMAARYSPAELADRIVLTGTRGSRLQEIAAENGYTFLPFPERIGGRYSAFSPVCLLPIAVAGLDVEAYLQGGEDMEKQLAAASGGAAARYAAIRSVIYKQGFSVEMLAAFEPRLFWAQSWWKQLFGESEGKDKKGLLPACMSNTEDLHSMGQYMQDGRRCMMETFLMVDDPGAQLEVMPDPAFGDGFDYLDGMDFANINRAAEKATVQAHDAGGVPCVQLRLPRIDERVFGQLFYFFMVSCALSGKLLGVDPFDQEGVEEYKRSMFAALGKPPRGSR